MRLPTNQLWSTGIRVAALAGKAALMLVLANNLEVANYGVFGLVVTTVGFAVYLLGFDFYTHSVRSLVGEDGGRAVFYVRDQLVFILLGYFLWLPLLILVFTLDVIPDRLAVQFYFLLVCEHLSTELYRLLVAQKKPVSASICFFIRNALWAYLLLALIFLADVSTSVEKVMEYWIAGGVTSVVYGFMRLELDWRRTTDVKIDWSWINKGIVVGAGFLAGTLLIRATGVIDRYLINAFLGSYYVGIYMLYISISGIVSTFFESGLLMHAFPGILEAYKKKDMHLFRMRLGSFFRQSVILSVMLTAAAFGFLVLLIKFGLMKEDYGSELTCFFVILVGVLVKNVTFTPHYSLYVRGEDMKILAGNVAGFIAAAILCIMLIPDYGITGAAVAILVSNMLILTVKAGYARGLRDSRA